MARPAFEVEGMRDTRRKLRQAGDDLSDLKDLHKRLADDIAGTAKTKTPERSGRLRRSVRGSGTKTAARIRAGNNQKNFRHGVQYAGPIHFGWAEKNIKPQPFMYEALDDRRQEVVDRYNDEVRTIIRRTF